MKTEMIIVSSTGRGIDAALALADKTAEQLGLTGKSALHLRLLAEEMMSMLRSIISGHVGQFWIEATGSEYRLHLKTVTTLSAEQRAQLIAASTKGKNEAHRGLMGKILAFFEPIPLNEAPSYLAGTIVTGLDGSLTWSMETYREALSRSKDATGKAREEWDELEKSLVSHLADDIRICIRGVDVELVIHKALK